MEIIDKIRVNDDEFKIENTINDYFLGCFGDRRDESLDFYTSLDGIEWSKLNIQTNLPKQLSWDHSIIYDDINKQFILSYSSHSDSETPVRSFAIYTSKDFREWTYHSIHLPGDDYTLSLWGPDLLLDDGTLIVAFSMGTANEDMGNYITKCSDLVNFSNWSQPKKLKVPGVTYTIDGNIIKDNGLYKLILKNGKNDEVANTIQIFQSTNLEDWTLVNNAVFSGVAEGCGITKFGKGQYYILADLFKQHGQICCKTNDLTKTTKWTRIKTLPKQRHGDILFIDTPELKNIIGNEVNFAGNQEDIGITNGERFTGTIDYLTIYPGFQYGFSGTTVINNLINPFNIEVQPCYFVAGTNASLTIKNYGYNLNSMNEVNRVYNNGNGQNGKIFNLYMNNATVRADINNYSYETVSLTPKTTSDGTTSDITVTNGIWNEHGTSGQLWFNITANKDIANTSYRITGLNRGQYNIVCGGQTVGDYLNIYKINNNTVEVFITSLKAGKTEKVRIPVIL